MFGIIRSAPPTNALLVTHRGRRLELLASHPQGDTEELLVLAHGFDGDMIAGLVSIGFATARRETIRAGDRTIEVVRIRITAAGRDALAAEG